MYKQLVYHSPTEERLIVSNCIYHGQSDNNLDGGGEKWILDVLEFQPTELANVLTVGAEELIIVHFLIT